MRGATAAKVVTTVSWLVIVLVALLALAALAMVGYVVYYYVARGWLAPVRRTQARVILKQDREHEVDVPKSLVEDELDMLIDTVRVKAGWDPMFTVYRYWDYFITFAFDGGQQEFAVKEDLYASVHEGDEGLLVYKGNLLKHFIPGALKAEEISPTHRPV